MSKLTTFLTDNNLSYDKDSNLAYGRLSGFPFLLIIGQKDTVSELVFSVTRQGQVLTDEDGQLLKGSSEAVANVMVANSLVRIVPKAGLTANKRYENVKQAIDASLAFFQQQGFTTVCQLTGEEGADLYLIGSGAQFLSQAGLEQQRALLLSKETDVTNTKEHFVPGLVGAFLGSVLGVIVSVIIGQLGYVAVISGIVMGVATLKGYELLGKRLSMKGIITSSLIMIAMTYFAFHVDLAFTIARVVEVDIFSAFEAIPYLLETGDLSMTDYLIELGKIYLFTLLGAVPTILSTLKEQKTQYLIRQLP